MLRTVNERLLSRTVNHAVGVQRLAAGAAQQIIDILDDSDEAIFAVIRSRILGNANTALRMIYRINERTFREIGSLLARQLHDLTRYEVEHNQDVFDTVLPFDWQLTKPKAKFLRAIINEEAMHGGLLDEWIEGMATGRYTRIRQAVRIGVTAGETPDEIIRRIRGQQALQYRNGVAEINRRSARAVVLTLHNHVANKARATLYRVNDDLIYGVVWTAVLDDVTCEECASLDGEEYDSRESALEPPLHLNCRCVLAPLIASADDLDLDDDELYSSREEIDGRNPGKLRYSDWLHSQDKETQDDILGKDRATLFRRGIPIKKFRDYTGRRYTLPELKLIEGGGLKVKSRAPLVVTGKRRTFGWKPDLPDQRDFLFAVEEPKEIALPVRVSLRDHMPPVWNQGNLGSCVSHAILAAAMFAFGPETPMLSRLDLYYKARLLEDNVESDDGAEIRDGVKALARWGVCQEATWPYKIRAFRQQPPKVAADEDQQYRIKSYMRLKGHDDFVRCLALGYPFVGGFTVYENFDDNLVRKDGILPLPTVDQALVGGHAVLFTGYDTDFHSNPVFKQSGLHESQVPAVMYEARNSFGPEWGDNGHFWIPATYVEDRDLSEDFWTIRK